MPASTCKNWCYSFHFYLIDWFLWLLCCGLLLIIAYDNEIEKVRFGQLPPLYCKHPSRKKSFIFKRVNNLIEFVNCCIIRKKSSTLISWPDKSLKKNHLQWISRWWQLFYAIQTNISILLLRLSKVQRLPGQNASSTM